MSRCRKTRRCLSWCDRCRCSLSSTAAIGDNNGVFTNITATSLTASAAWGIDLDTNVASLKATTSAPGNIDLSEFDAITLTEVTSKNGGIAITSGGSMVVTKVVSSTDNDLNDIVLTATSGDITVVEVSAGATAGDVTLSAIGTPTSSIIDDDNQLTRITGDIVTLNASLDIGRKLTLPQKDIDTTANTILASTSATPRLRMFEAFGSMIAMGDSSECNDQRWAHSDHHGRGYQSDQCRGWGDYRQS